VHSLDNGLVELADVDVTRVQVQVELELSLANSFLDPATMNKFNSQM
jgi:hypothetical protein